MIIASVLCIAELIYHESRSEPIEGQIATGQVVMSRVASHHFPDTPCDVIKQGGERKYRCQFTYWCDGKPETIANKPAYGQAFLIATGVYFNVYPDLIDNATHYHADYVQPEWSKHLHRTTKIGRHIFYKM